VKSVLVIGASRGVGFETVKQALEAGHSVRALARTAGSIPLDHPGLTKLEGSALDQTLMENAILGVDVVITTLGISPTLQPVHIFSETAKCVIGMMEKHGVERLIAVTGIGAGDSRNKEGPFFSRLLKPVFLGQVYADKDREEDLIRRSNLDWVIVRPGFLTRFAPTGNYKVITDPEEVEDGFIPRGDVAHFLVQLIEDRSFSGLTPALIS